MAGAGGGHGEGEVDGGFKHGVGAFEGELGVEVDFQVGGDALLGGAHLRVVDRRGREADGPAAWDLGIERNAGSTAGAVAHKSHIVERMHERGEIVGRAERAAVGKNNYRLVPCHAAGRRLEIVGVGLRKVAVAGARFVRDVSCKGAT